FICAKRVISKQRGKIPVVRLGSGQNKNGQSGSRRAAAHQGQKIVFAIEPYVGGRSVGYEHGSGLWNELMSRGGGRVGGRTIEHHVHGLLTAEEGQAVPLPESRLSGRVEAEHKAIAHLRFSSRCRQRNHQEKQGGEFHDLEDRNEIWMEDASDEVVTSKMNNFDFGHWLW